MTEYDPYKRWGNVIDAGSVIVDDKISCDPTNEATRFTMVYDVRVGGPLKLLSSSVNSAMRKELKQAVSDLKVILDAQS